MTASMLLGFGTPLDEMLGYSNKAFALPARRTAYQWTVLLGREGSMGTGTVGAYGIYHCYYIGSYTPSSYMTCDILAAFEDKNRELVKSPGQVVYGIARYPRYGAQSKMAEYAGEAAAEILNVPKGQYKSYAAYYTKLLNPTFREFSSYIQTNWRGGVYCSPGKQIDASLRVRPCIAESGVTFVYFE